MGPSPRVRGIPKHDRTAMVGRRSIPARAGNPRCEHHGRVGDRVHPRACGESAELAHETPVGVGPSPRVRGIPKRHDTHNVNRGSIPARAGNPLGLTRWAAMVTVHPRACGESIRRPVPPRPVAGPSPRVRGIQTIAAAAADCPRSIPARAGNPQPGPIKPQRWRVHPRACGESQPTGETTMRNHGPSPRVRGIQESAMP